MHDFPQESYNFKEKVSNIMNKGETRERGKVICFGASFILHLEFGELIEVCLSSCNQVLT